MKNTKWYTQSQGKSRKHRRKERKNGNERKGERPPTDVSSGFQSHLEMRKDDFHGIATEEPRCGIVKWESLFVKIETYISGFAIIFNNHGRQRMRDMLNINTHHCIVKHSNMISYDETAALY